MNKLIIRQYVPSGDSGASCAPCEETKTHLLSVIENLSPKLANLNIQPDLQVMEIHTITERNAGKLNFISFFSPETGIPEEKSIEEVLGVPVSYEMCEGCLLPDGTSFKTRTLGIEGREYQALPPGVLTDALIRVVFSTFESCGGGSCDTCAGCIQD
ncbi:DUF2703 domain-containing protein [Aminivibrio sp.]|uniref:DUF2703 domain-containing protein n=1 Tax=Aminivibrio sp. TaxID=1872489 RepID=UPI001A51E4B6|nr:DUF2703 domain-containing protein [Aminivibrio sp.]MBL3538469.1 DUF2703 domain-containing protein [Aminivibrio sp.]